MKKILSSLWIVLVIIAFSMVLVRELKKMTEQNANINESPNEAKVEQQAITSDNENSIVEADSSAGEDNELTVVFGGDVLFSQSMLNTYNKNGGKAQNIMAKNLITEFQKADIAMFNQEFPFSLRGVKMEDKQFTFRADPKYVKVFSEMGIDIVSLANNHTLDYGIDALVDSFDTLNKASILYGGAGNNLEEAKEVKYIERDGQKVAFLCASRVIPVTDWNATSSRPGMLTTYDPTTLIEQIKLAKENADYAVVYVHWGLEHKEMPEDYQRTLGKQYIDAGADAVIGCHTHCLQGTEIYNGKPIVYSLGNFMFGGNTDRTMMVKLKLDKEITTVLYPCEAKSYCTFLIEDEQRKESFYEYYKGISFGVDIDSEGYVKSIN